MNVVALRLVSVSVFSLMSGIAFAGAPVWPEVTQTAKPWVYNWWMASAVDEKGLENQCAELEKAGFGGFHVIPIYGAKGYEKQWRTMLSPEWVEAWNLAVRIVRIRPPGSRASIPGTRWGRGAHRFLDAVRTPTAYVRHLKESQ